MRICFIIDSYVPNIGGHEIAARYLIEGLAQSGIQCLIITTRFSFKIKKIEEFINIKIIRIKVFKFFSRLTFSIFSIWKIINRGKDYDIIHGMSYGGAFPAYFCAKILKKKSIFTIHEIIGNLWDKIESNIIKRTLYKLTEKAICSMAFDRFIAVSQYTQSSLKAMGVDSNKLSFIYWGNDTPKENTSSLDIKKHLGFSRENYIFLAYGRLGLTKGFEYFIMALKDILNKVPIARFILILSDYNKKLKKSIDQKLKNLPDYSYRSINPLADRGELYEYLSIADCIVIPSLSEGFGFAVVESCSLNKTVLATTSGSIPEVIYGNHIMVEPFSCNALVKGCLRAFEKDVNYLPPKNFEWTKTVNDYRNTYEMVLET